MSGVSSANLCPDEYSTRSHSYNIMTRLAALALALTASAAVAAETKPYSAATVLGLDPARERHLLLDD